jgi:DNA-binding transcriptional MerR regulator
MPKARIQKRLYYKIGEACKELGIQPYVLRYWETEFPALAPSKSRSGQRVYSEKELEIIRRIKQLLYDEGYTIAGAKKKLEVELANGLVGGEPQDSEAGETADPEAPAAPALPRRSTRARTAAAVPADPGIGETDAASTGSLAAEAEPASLLDSLDTDASERIQKLRSGIEKALQEAREILSLLESK